MNKKTAIIISVIFLVLIVWAVSTKKSEKAHVAGLSSRAVALTCTTDMATEYHIHPFLKIVTNGKEEVIPANIGITATCMNSIHTHDVTGEIHVEAPVAKDFTLGDFFAVWQKNFSSTQIIDSVLNEKTEIVVTVNGAPVDTYENTLLRDGDKIVIEYKKK